MTKPMHEFVVRKMGENTLNTYNSYSGSHIIKYDNICWWNAYVIKCVLSQVQRFLFILNLFKVTNKNPISFLFKVKCQIMIIYQ